MRRIFFAMLLASPAAMLVAPEAQAQAPGCATGAAGGYAASAGGYAGAGGFGGSTTGGYYRQSLYGGSPAPFYGPFGFAMRMYPLIHFHGPLVNYGPYEGYYPFQPYGPWTSDLKYAGAPLVQPAATGWGWGLGSHSHSHAWGHYALATFHNVGKRLHLGKSSCSSCQASAAASGEIVPVESVAVVPVVRER
jgi:hypothetical protein